jgi:hypothetical protein
MVGLTRSSISARGHLVLVEGTSMNSHSKHIIDIPEDHLVPFATFIGDKFTPMAAPC